MGYKNNRYGVKQGKYRSKLESKVAYNLQLQGIIPCHEEVKIRYIVPESEHTYLADFLLPNGIIVEVKGLFESADRKKHLLIKTQHPELDIRFVFGNAKTAIYPGSTTTLGEWCKKHGFVYSEKTIPTEWLHEPPKPRSLLITPGMTVNVKEK